MLVHGEHLFAVPSYGELKEARDRSGAFLSGINPIHEGSPPKASPTNTSPFWGGWILNNSSGRTQAFRPNAGEDTEHQKLLFIADAIDTGNWMLFGKDKGACINFTLIPQRNFCVWIAEIYKDNKTVCHSKQANKPGNSSSVYQQN